MIKKYKREIHFIAFIAVFLISFKINYNPLTRYDLDFGPDVVAILKKTDLLYKEIEEKSTMYYEEPQNAVIDRVWKKTPGRNGVKVNIEKSYDRMRKEGNFNQSLLVFDQIKPEIVLQDLEPAPIFRGHPEKDMIALLINVSWGGEYLPEILNTLKEHKVRATFFIEGKWAKENAELVKMIDEQGHLVGNHAYNHPDMAHLSKEENEIQIKQTNDIITAILDKKPKWFAPPSGSFNEAVVKIADQLQMETIMWTVDTIDWKKPSVSVMINRVMSQIHPGAMILMHPTLPVQNGLDALLSDIKEAGYRIDTVEKLLSEER